MVQLRCGNRVNAGEKHFRHHLVHLVLPAVGQIWHTYYLDVYLSVIWLLAFFLSVCSSCKIIKEIFDIWSEPGVCCKGMPLWSMRELQQYLKLDCVLWVHVCSSEPWRFIIRSWSESVFNFGQTCPKAFDCWIKRLTLDVFGHVWSAQLENLHTWILNFDLISVVKPGSTTSEENTGNCIYLERGVIIFFCAFLFHTNPPQLKQHGWPSLCMWMFVVRLVEQ